ncbi:MAG: hypothetical protein ACXQS5_01620, partial [Candidatus Methanospirareceae archaeon]
SPLFKSPLVQLAQPAGTDRKPVVVNHRSSPIDLPIPHLLHRAIGTKPDSSRAERTDIYRTYPEIEHAAPTNTEVIKERVIEKEVDFKPPQIASQPSGIDANRLADQIYQLIERRVRIDRERRGL